MTLLQGPAGSGKSQAARDLLANGEATILADVTALWAALTGAVRDPETGLYPERADADPGLAAARQVQERAVRVGLRDGESVVVTTSRRGQESRWAGVAIDSGALFSARTIDPGFDVVSARLADPVTGTLSGACSRALSRWYVR